MKHPSCGAGILGLVLVTGLIGSPASGNTDGEEQTAATGMERIVVVAPRIVRERPRAGRRHLDLTVVERRTFVEAFDLNLRHTADFQQLEERVREAASDVCEELARDYPAGQPGTMECIRRAFDDAMARVRELINE